MQLIKELPGKKKPVETEGTMDRVHTVCTMDALICCGRFGACLWIEMPGVRDTHTQQP